MPAQLIALNEGPSILVDKPILLLGRHPECDIQIDSRKISRRHCCIAQVNDYLVVRDLDSTNGIRINGVRVVEGRLMPGDELTIGNHRYQVSWEEVPVSPVAAVSARPRPRVPIDEHDAPLDECDGPAPRPDPGPPARPPLPRTAEGPVLPEDLKLLPGSGSFPGSANATGK